MATSVSSRRTAASASITGWPAAPAAPTSLLPDAKAATKTRLPLTVEDGHAKHRMDLAKGIVD